MSSPPPRAAMDFSLNSTFVLHYRKPGTEACQTSKILSILHGVRFNLSTEKSNGDGAPASRAIKVVRDVFTRTGFSFRPLQDGDLPVGLVKQLGTARQGDAALESARCLPASPGHRCHTTPWEQQGCQLCFYTSLLFLNKKLSRS